MRLLIVAALIIPAVASAEDPPAQPFTVAVRLDTPDAGESHVAVTCDGHTARMYVDGEPRRTWPTGPAADPTSVLWSVQDTEAGEVEVVAVSLYERELSTAEIARLPECPAASAPEMRLCTDTDLCACEPPAPPAPAPE